MYIYIQLITTVLHMVSCIMYWKFNIQSRMLHVGHEDGAVEQLGHVYFGMALGEQKVAL